ncbi:hypothetical protein PUN28_016949 [Cardiocondyla obscurior]|uniref:Uncharacterized protein n=1 Tax=Cardiocondyla obscurior TaxID=286306 RepID=A0AAW2EPH5_9HYME
MNVLFDELLMKETNLPRNYLDGLEQNSFAERQRNFAAFVRNAMVGPAKWSKVVVKVGRDWRHNTTATFNNLRVVNQFPRLRYGAFYVQELFQTCQDKSEQATAGAAAAEDV